MSERTDSKRQRVLILGDSTAYGFGLEDGETFAVELARRLPKIEVLNAAVAGSTAWQQRGLFAQRAHLAQPDIVVLQVLFNDLYGYFSFERRLFARGDAESKASSATEPSALELRLIESLRD